MIDTTFDRAWFPWLTLDESEADELETERIEGDGEVVLLREVPR